ncbi:MAG: hypothetical protein DRI01_09355 [Chloroflexi bacterium]|nr:MAG: hypothetical protein DRI01_09355 [Chloroflexota bacterium]
MAEKNGSHKDVIELWGRNFARVRNGLDEEQVVSFINELISQRNTFLYRQEHLSSLTKLAERTIAEANDMAKQIKEEATAQANAEVTAIIAEAEQQAQQMIEEKRTEVITIANKEAEAIRAAAQQQAKLLLEEKTRSVQVELKDTAQSLYRQFLTQLESLQQQIIVLETEFEHTLSQTMKRFDPIIERGLPSRAPAPIGQENNFSSSIDSGMSSQLDNSELKKTAPVSAENEETTDYKGEVKLEILPPVDLKQIIELMRHLDSLPEVETTELIPAADKPSIIVFLRQPIRLIEILRTLPEVEQVEKVTSGEATSFTETLQSKRREIQVTLSKDRILTETKEVLASEVSNAQTSTSQPNLK